MCISNIESLLIMSKNIVLIGSSSELASEFSNINTVNNIYKISSTNNDLNNSNNLVINSYLDDADDIVEFIGKINSPVLIFFNGYLKENRPSQEPNFKQVLKTIEANYFVPYLITIKLLQNNISIKKFIFISSFAATKIRYKNFIYGYSKKILEESIKSLKIENFLIIRFGKINTSLSKNHKNTLLDLSKNQAAKFIYTKLGKEFGVIYSSKFLYFVSRIILITPNYFLKKFNI